MALSNIFLEGQPLNQRESVRLCTVNNQKLILKKHAKINEAKEEEKMHRYLFENGINVPKFHRREGELLLMEYIEGDVLSDVSERFNDKELEQLIDSIIKPIISIGVTPFDLHPKNILIKQDKNYCIVDFEAYECGIAKDLDEVLERDWIITLCKNKTFPGG